MVSIFSDLNRAQIYRLLYRDSPHHEIELVMSFDYLNFFKPNEHREDYHIRKPNDEDFLNEKILRGIKNIYFETNDIIVKYSSELGFNDVNYLYAFGEENIYFILHQNFIHSSIQEFESSIEKDEYQYLYEKDDELKSDIIRDENEGVVEYGNDFINCIIIHSKQ